MMNFAKKILIFFLALYFLESRLEARFNKEEKIDVKIKKLIAIYKENNKLEKLYKNKLTFSIAEKDKQFTTFKKGWGSKLILKDDLGEYWIFKEGKKEIKAVGVYRLYKLFGISTPRIFPISLPINGRLVQGSIQKLIKGVTNLENIPPSILSSDILQQLLKIHMFDWLISNHDSVGENFLLKPKERNLQEKIWRVDNDSAFVTFENDRLDEHYAPPWFFNPKEGYYYLIWLSYRKGEISFDFNKAYNFALLISEFPDEIFSQILKDTLNTLFSGKRKIVYEYYRKYNRLLLQRKNNLPQDIKKFYLNLLQVKNPSIFFRNEHYLNSILNQLYLNLKKDNENLKRKLKLLEEHKREKQPQINVVYSQKAWEIIHWFIVREKIRFVKENNTLLLNMDLSSAQKIFEEYLRNKFIENFDSLISQMWEIYESTKCKYEKLAILYYIAALYKLKKEKSSLYTLKRIVIPIE